MRLDREPRLLALCPLDGPSSLRQGQGDGYPNDLIRGFMLTMMSVGGLSAAIPAEIGTHVGIHVSSSVTICGYQIRYQAIIRNRT